MGTLTYLVPGIRSRLDVVPFRDDLVELLDAYEVVARARSGDKWVEVTTAVQYVPLGEADAHEAAEELVRTFAHASVTGITNP